MILHMRTTLIIDDGVMRRLKAEAARQKRTLTALVDEALRSHLDRRPTARQMPAPLPTFSSRPLVDVSDRDALYQAMEGR